MFLSNSYRAAFLRTPCIVFAEYLNFLKFIKHLLETEKLMQNNIIIKNL